MAESGGGRGWGRGYAAASGNFSIRLGRLGSTLLIKLRANISFSIRAILIPHTDQGHSDYYTLLKINSGNGPVPDMCYGDERPSLKPQQEELERKEVAARGDRVSQGPSRHPTLGGHRLLRLALPWRLRRYTWP